MSQVVAADLLGRPRFGLEDEVQRVWLTMLEVQRACDLQAVPDLALHRHRAHIDGLPECGGSLKVTELSGHRYLMDSDVGMQALLGEDTAGVLAATVAAVPLEIGTPAASPVTQRLAD